MKKMLLAFLALAACSMLSSCDAILSLFNTPPEVTVSVDDATAYSDQAVTFTATATDANNDTLRYQWYVNGTAVSGETSSTYSCYWLVSADTTATVKCTVADAYAESSASVTETLMAGASFRVHNHSSSSIYFIYCTLSSSSTWGSDLLGSGNVLSANKGFTIYNLGASSYDLLVEFGSGYSLTARNKLMELGKYRTVDINSETDGTVSDNQNSSILINQPTGDKLQIRDALGKSPLSTEGPGISPIQDDPVLLPGRDERIPFSVK